MQCTVSSADVVVKVEMRGPGCGLVSGVSDGGEECERMRLSRGGVIYS